MNKRLLIAALAAAYLPALSCYAQVGSDPRSGPSTPVQVTNPDPIKVMVVPPQRPAQVLCTLRGTTTASNSNGIVSLLSGSGSMITTLSCPVGLKGVLARRAVLAFDQGSNPENISNAMAVFGFSKEENPGGIPDLGDMNLVTGLSYSVPEKVLEAPIPVTLQRAVRTRLTCSGMPGVPTRCTGGLYLIGDPIPE